MSDIVYLKAVQQIKERLRQYEKDCIALNMAFYYNMGDYDFQNEKSLNQTFEDAPEELISPTKVSCDSSSIELENTVSRQSYIQALQKLKRSKLRRSSIKINSMTQIEDQNSDVIEQLASSPLRKKQKRRNTINLPQKSTTEEQITKDGDDQEQQLNLLDQMKQKEKEIMSFNPPKAMDKKFVFLPLTKANNAVSQFLAEEFSSRELWSICLDQDFDYSTQLLSFYVEKALRENVGVICLQANSQEIAMVISCEDLSTSKIDPIYSENLIQQLPKAVEDTQVFDDWEEKFPDFYRVENSYECLHIFLMAANAQFGGLGLCSKGIEYLMNQHPITSKYKQYIAEATSSGSQVVFQRAGFKQQGEIFYDDLRNKAGEYPFKEEIRKKKLNEKGLPDSQKCVLYSFEQN